MSKINTVFLLGILGILFTSVFHILMAAVTSQEAAASDFWVMYPIFSGFLIAGTYIMTKRKDPLRK